MRIQVSQPLNPAHLLEQLRNFPVHMGAEEGRPEQEHLDACLLLGAGDLELVAAHPFPAAAALLRSMPRRGPLLGEDGMARGRREAWRQLYAALREAFPPAPEAVRCLDKLGPLEANALHILAMREGGEPVAVRTEALGQLSKLELIRVDVDGRPFPLELTPLGLEVWALRQPGSPVNRYEVERARIHKLVEASGGRLVTTAEQRPRTATFYFEPLDRAPEVHEMRRDGSGILEDARAGT